MHDKRAAALTKHLKTYLEGGDRYVLSLQFPFELAQELQNVRFCLLVQLFGCLQCKDLLIEKSSVSKIRSQFTLRAAFTFSAMAFKRSQMASIDFRVKKWNYHRFDFGFDGSRRCNSSSAEAKSLRS